ncbi:MAG: hypothetical protein ACRBB6_14000 [Neptuniibacter sp.]
MKWMIIIMIMMSLVGSMMWVMPTKRQKYQAALRMKAKTLGYQVQLERVTAPRAKGEMDAETRDMTAYRLIRHGLNKQEKNAFKSWKIFRVESISDTDLPPGWSWGSGERTLKPVQLEHLSEVLAKLPNGVFSLESTPIHIGMYWDEEGGDNALQELKVLLETFMDEGF